MNNRLMITSDQHANWDALEKIYKAAHENNTPLIINGDLVGDYQFDGFRRILNILYPQEILDYEVKQELSKQTRQLSQEEVMQIYQKKAQEKQNDLIRHQSYAKKLYYIYIETTAKKLVNLIEKYQVKTYFLLGNHEPLFFHQLVQQIITNKELYVDMNKEEGIIDINGIKVCGISNTNALMPFINHIFQGQELYMNFLHQLSPDRKLLTGDESEFINQIKWDESYKQDFDWKRIVKTSQDEEIINSKNLDLFVSHGQIGTGKWSDEKTAQQVPTLMVAAAMSYFAKLTVDGHLHTSYEMDNAMGKQSIRAVGNKAYIITKDDLGEIHKELIEVDAKYDARGFEIFDNVEEIRNKVFQ